VLDRRLGLEVELLGQLVGEPASAATSPRERGCRRRLIVAAGGLLSQHLTDEAETSALNSS